MLSIIRCHLLYFTIDWKLNIMNWLKGKRVFSRWKLIAMILIGVWVGFMAALGEYIFAIIYGLLGIWELTKKS